MLEIPSTRTGVDDATTSYPRFGEFTTPELRHQASVRRRTSLGLLVAEYGHAAGVREVFERVLVAAADEEGEVEDRSSAEAEEGSLARAAA